MTLGIEFDALEITKMANAHSCLNLSSKIAWEAFPAFAGKFLSLCNGQVLDKAEAPDMHLWKVKIAGADLNFVLDDYPIMVSLESADATGDRVIDDLHKKLRPALQIL
jgi:hypothetical protein